MGFHQPASQPSSPSVLAYFSPPPPATPLSLALLRTSAVSVIGLVIFHWLTRCRRRRCRCRFVRRGRVSAARATVSFAAVLHNCFVVKGLFTFLQLRPSRALPGAGQPRLPAESLKAQFVLVTKPTACADLGLNAFSSFNLHCTTKKRLSWLISVLYIGILSY